MQVIVRGDSFVELILGPAAGSRAGAFTRSWRVASGASLLASMLKAAYAHVQDEPQFIARDREANLIVELERREIRRNREERKVVGVKSIRACDTCVASSPLEPLTPAADTMVVFSDAPRLNKLTTSPNTSLDVKGCPLVLLSHHPVDVADRLHNHVRSKTVIVVDANSLRDNRSQCQLGTLSCEQAVVDYWRELTDAGSDGVLAKLSSATDHLVVALGPGATLYCHFAETGHSSHQVRRHGKLRLVFDTAEGYEIAPKLWTDVGFCNILTVGISAFLAKRPNAPWPLSKVIAGIKHGIFYSLKHRNNGYDVNDALVKDDGAQAQIAWCKGIFQPASSATEVEKIKAHVVRIPEERLVGGCCWDKSAKNSRSGRHVHKHLIRRSGNSEDWRTAR